MAFSLLRKVNEKVLNSVSLLDASLDVDYIIADVKNSITSNKPEKVEVGINSLVEFGEKNRNALILQREWVQLVFWVISWMGNDINKNILSNILQLIIRMINDNKDNSKFISCCDFPNPFPTQEDPIEIENAKIIEEIANVSKGGTQLLETLRHINYEEADIYIKYDIVKILSIIQKSGLGSFKLDQIILSQGDCMGLLLELIMDGLDNHSSYLQNSLELLMLLTKSNSEVQKMITYNGSISKILNIIQEETQQFIKKDGPHKGFINSDSIINEFLLITDFGSAIYSNLEILQISVEILFHITKSQNCLKFILEASNEAQGFLDILTDLIGFCFLFLEYSFYNNEMYNVDVVQGIESLIGNEQNVILASIILRVVEISNSYIQAMNTGSSSNMAEKMREILSTMIASPVLIKFGLLEKVIQFSQVFQDQNPVISPEWCSMILSSAITPALWFGFNKIISDYKPTIDYITENKSSDIEQHAKQIQELREKYMNQMENSLLEWFGVVIIPKNFSLNLLISRDDSVFKSLINNQNLGSFSLDKLYSQDMIFKDFISFCFWFPITEFQRLYNKSVFSKLEVQLASEDGLQGCQDDENTLNLTIIFHYRLFRCIQLLQVLILNGVYSSNKKYFKINDITSVVNKIWENEQPDNDKALNSSNSSQNELFGKLIDLGRPMITDISEALESEYKTLLLNLIRTYGTKDEDENMQINKNSHIFNAMTTLTQLVISLIAFNVKNPDLEIPNSFIQSIKLLDEKLKSQLSKDSCSLITDIISVLLFRFGALKNTNILNQINKRFKNHYYNGFVLSKQTHACILHAILNCAGNRGIYSKEDLSFKEKMDPDIFVPAEQGMLLKSEDECVNCIYLTEKMLNDRRNLIKIIRNKQEEINVLVKAYMDSQEALKNISMDQDEAEPKKDFFGKKNAAINKTIDTSDYFALLEMVGILYRRFPTIKEFIESHLMLSNQVKSEISSVLLDEDIQNFEYEYLTDSGEILLEESDQQSIKNSTTIIFGDDTEDRLLPTEIGRS
ncbi:VDP USO1 YBL047C family vesicular transport factor [Cryptosporidium sp. chipmunk genotype I]|uniref:VDP USO1 YBL047C family vesicular transport factor n=1 Tax=Cryptosporidium sp. chipmunk genotype I TaxID=1280935 RepID=UPI00351A0A2A|nr:VDP USO1 YBL047C family vesicular transport factor [Cryptosporidium sp. chipmunk genotype I]